MALIVASRDSYICIQYLSNYPIDNTFPIGIEGIVTIVEELIQHQEGAMDVINGIEAFQPTLLKSTQQGQLALLEIANLLIEDAAKSLIENIEKFQINPDIYFKELLQIIEKS